MGDSRLWKAIVGAWNEIKHWMGWGIGNGCQAKFWIDRWIHGKSMTKDLGLVDIPVLD